MKILITGGFGFVGANLAIYLKKNVFDIGNDICSWMIEDKIKRHLSCR
jgi:nucleoside-diphosphate-sugar epimerase